LKNGSVSINASASANEGTYWYGHTLTCSISVNYPATIVILAGLGHSEYPSNGTSHLFVYNLHFDGVFVRRFQSVLATKTEYDDWNNQYVSYHRSEGATAMMSFNVNPGTHTVGVAGYPYYSWLRFLRRDISITALMR